MHISPAPETDFVIADDVFVKHIVIPEAGSVVPQHSHRYDHVTFIAAGSLWAWAGEELLGKFTAPCPIVIKAGVKHTFRTLVDNTVILCVHNASRPDVAAVVEENTTADALAAVGG